MTRVLHLFIRKSPGGGGGAVGGRGEVSESIRDLEPTGCLERLVDFVLNMACKFDLEVIIKLGGSAVTHKNAFETVNQDAIAAAAKLVKNIKGKCVVVHGAG